MIFANTICYGDLISMDLNKVINTYIKAALSGDRGTPDDEAAHLSDGLMTSRNMRE